MNFTLKQLSYFVAAAEQGSIAAAAKVLHLSESAVSSAVADLETALGAVLCTRRKSQGIVLTPSGRFVLERARALLREADNLQHETTGGSGVLVGPVVIGCSPGLAPTLLPPVLAEAAETFPLIELDFVLGAQDELVPRLLAGEIDAVILPGNRLPADTVHHKLFDAPVEVLLPADHRLADVDEVDLSELADEPFIMLDVSPGINNVDALFAAIDRSPVLRYRTESVELIRSLVARGLGYSLMLRRPWPARTYDGGVVVTKPVTPRLADDYIAVAGAARMPLSARAAAIVRLIQRLWSTPVD